MPSLFANQHTRFMNEFKYQGKPKNMYDKRRVYCLHKLGHMFLAIKYMKYLVSQANTLFYITMFMPIHSKTH